MTAPIHLVYGSRACLCQVSLILAAIMGQLCQFVTSMPVSSGDPQGPTANHVGEVRVECPDTCVCDIDLFLLRCDNRNFTRVPPNTNHSNFDAQILNLAFNRIQILHNASFIHLESLRILHLEYNQIDWIQPLSFQRLTSLQQLYLQQNKLRYLDPLTFKGLGRLGALNLSHNSMMQISPRLLVHTPWLNTLDLSGNQLVYLPNSSAFLNLTNLVTLNLSENRLSNLEASMLSRLSSLKNLYLGQLDMEVIDSNLFVSLTDLTVVDLSQSSIHIIRDPWGFNKLKQLRRLYLSGISITCDCNAIDLMEWVSISPNIETGLSNSEMSCRLLSEPNRLAVKRIRIADLSCKQNRVVVSLKPVEEPIDLAYRIPYDPMLGWYTAATLSTLLGAFLVCVGLDKLKNKLLIWRYNYRKRKRLLAEAEQNTPLQTRHKNCKRGAGLGSDGDTGNDSDSDDEGGGMYGDSYESQNDSTINPDDQPIMPTAHSDQFLGDGTGRRETNLQHKFSLSSRLTNKGSAKANLRADVRYKSDSNKNYASHPCMTEAVRPDTLPKLEVNHSGSAIKSQKEKRTASERKELVFNLHVLEIHPDCPIHSQKKATFASSNKEQVIESNF